MAQSVIPIDFTMATVTFIDGAANERSLRYFDGELTISGLKYVQNELLKFTTQGALNATGYGEPTYPTMSMKGHLTEFSDNAEGTALDMVLRRGKFDPELAGYTNSPGTKDDVGPGRTLHVRIDINKRRSNEAPISFTANDCIIDPELSFGTPGMQSFAAEVLGRFTGDLKNRLLADL